MRKGEQTHSSEGNVTVLKLSRVTVKYSTLVMTEKKATACSPKKQLKAKTRDTGECCRHGDAPKQIDL